MTLIRDRFPWTPNEDAILEIGFKRNNCLKGLSVKHLRSEAVIKKRLIEIGYLNEDEPEQPNDYYGYCDENQHKYHEEEQLPTSQDLATDDVIVKWYRYERLCIDNCLEEAKEAKSIAEAASISLMKLKKDHSPRFSSYSAYYDAEDNINNYEDEFGSLTEDGYTTEWPEISMKQRERRNFTCEECGVNLAKHVGYLHTHHIDHCKTNNLPSNLTVLCIRCHSHQGGHVHLFQAITPETHQLLTRLLKEQQNR